MIGGSPQVLARAERRLGLDSWAVSFAPSRYGYKADEVLWTKNDPLIIEIKRWALLYHALRHFDVVHFNFGQSFMPEPYFPPENRSQYPRLLRAFYNFYARVLELRDLPILRNSRKGIVVTYQGDEARQGDFCLKNFPIHFASEVEPGYYSRESDAHKRERIAKFAMFSDRIHALDPSLLHMLPSRASFLPFSQIDPADWQPIRNPTTLPRPPVVVHAPTHRRVKGTRFVLDAVSRLRAEGVPLEFVLVEGLTQLEARRIYQRADLLIDQLLAGWYGSVAVEAMALGKPVICYVRKDDLRFLPNQMRRDLSIINANPETIYDVLKEWVTKRRGELPEQGRRSRAYMERWHDPLKTAAMLKREYEDIMADR
jgi:glycosyltransferase involved in cell wall biosynthesis